MARGHRGYVVTIDRLAIIQDMAARGWTQRELAKRAKLTEMQVSRLVTGQAASQRVAAAVAKALGRSVGDFMSVDIQAA